MTEEEKRNMLKIVQQSIKDLDGMHNSIMDTKQYVKKLSDEWELKHGKNAKKENIEISEKETNEIEIKKYIEGERKILYNPIIYELENLIDLRIKELITEEQLLRELVFLVKKLKLKL